MLLKVDLRTLRNEEHHQCFLGINRLMKGSDHEKLRTDTQYPAFENALNLETVALEYVRKSEHTSTIASDNILRNGVFQSLVQQVKIQLKPGANPVKRKHAERLYVCVHHYRKTYSKAASERNATFRKFILDVRENYASELTALSLSEQVEELDLLCIRIDEMTDNRQFSRGHRAGYASVADARKQVDQQFMALSLVLNTAILIDGSPENLDLQEKLNGLLMQYKQVVGSRINARKNALAKQAMETVPDAGEPAMADE